MCGINGILAYHYAANPIDRAELVRTRDHMAARGPDGMGEWIGKDHRVGLGHRRLAIIDLTDAAAQPMVSTDGRLVVVFNGEIYNYRQLRGRLETRGYAFRTRSDTEVLLHLYAQKGAAMVHDLRGMFAFAIWDTERRTLLLARDPYGIKPLYYTDDGWTFRFASQVKALLAGGAVSHDPDPAGQVGFYLLGSVPEPFTTHREIRALPAGTTLLVDRLGAHEPKRYHSIAQAYCDAEAQSRRMPAMDDMDATGEIREALLDSVRRHLVADVPVGAFLSAGVDSGALVGLMRDAGQRDIQTVTIAFSEFRGSADDEAPLAEEVARLYGTRHTTRVVTQAEFEADLPRITEAMDQPSIDGINTWFASKAARELGLKVAVSGLGGDELLGGYPSFRDIPRWVRLLALPGCVPLLGKIARLAAQPLIPAVGANPKSAGMIELGGSYAGAYLLRRGLFMPWELRQLLAPDAVAEGLRRLAPMQLIASVIEPRPRSTHARVAALESSLYMRNQLLRDTDWASMAHSLEVRVPLVDRALLSRLAWHTARFRAGAGKQLLSAAPRRPLPETVYRRPKTGFATPMQIWMRRIAQGGGSIADRQAPAATAPQWARRWSLSVADRAQAIA
jgi:asparagine synthase (glutamine-hydrolysing)